MAFRHPDYIERFEYTPVELTSPLETNLKDNQLQKRTGLEFMINDLSRPIDWYDSFVKIGFKVDQLANGMPYNGESNVIAPCCGVQSFVKGLSVKVNGTQVYNGTTLAVGLFVKNLATFSKGYAESIAKNMFWRLDDHILVERTNYGFKERSQSIKYAQTVQAQLPLNCFSFFDSLNDKILPPVQMNLIFDLESDNNILWRDLNMTIATKKEEQEASTSKAPETIVSVTEVPNGRIIITNFSLWIKRINFNGVGLEKAGAEFFTTFSWLYQMEIVQRSHIHSRSQNKGEWQIMSAFKPRHVFIWFSATHKEDNQTQNRLIFDLFDLLSCQLFVGNGDAYPECRYETAHKDRIYRQFIDYSSANNYYNTSSQLTPWSWENLYPIYYFDLTYHRTMLDSSAQTLKFAWDLESNLSSTTQYYVNALILQEQKATYDAQTNKVTVE